MAEAQEGGENTTSLLRHLVSDDIRRRTREQTQPIVDAVFTPVCLRSTVLTVGSALLLLTTFLVIIRVSQNSRDDSISFETDGIPDWILDNIDGLAVRTHLQFISSDLMEGRAPGSRGEQITTQYVASHFQSAGLEPINNTYFQSVPMNGLVASYSNLTLGLQELTPLAEFVASSDLDSSWVSLSQVETVFVGYGIESSEFNWNDYKDVDVTNKIIVAFVNDPPATSSEPNLFGGDALTYYGRWTYKFEKARSKGALGALLIHTTASAGYDWQVVESSFGLGEQVSLQDREGRSLSLKGWITMGVAERLALENGATLQEWITKASTREFVPQELTSRLSSNMSYTTRKFEGTNVVARIGPKNAKEAIIMVAHHDHLGVRPSGSNNDSIYNGAVDNASGVAALITAAYAIGVSSRTPAFVVSTSQQPERAIIFLSATAEESNLLGASYFTRHAPCVRGLASSCIVTALNFDVMNVWGATSDVVSIGFGDSQALDSLISKAVAEEGMGITADPTPGQGHQFRSDQLPFALQGIPAMTLSTGTHFKNKPDDYYRNVSADYVQNRYHQPSDEYDPSWSMDGILQQVRLMLRIAYRLYVGSTKPEMNSSDLPS